MTADEQLRWDRDYHAWCARNNIPTDCGPTCLVCGPQYRGLRALARAVFVR